MIKNFDTLADRLKGITFEGKEIEPKKFIELLTSDKEVEITASSVHFFNDDEIGQLKANEKKAGYNEGKTAGEEMTIKAIKNAKGLEFEGKTIENLISAYDGKLTKELSKEPSEKLKEWESKYNTLKQTYESEKTGFENQVNQLNSKLEDYSINYHLNAIMPELNGIKKEHATMIFKNEYKIENKEGNFIAKKGNEIVKDKMGNPVKLDEILTSFVSNNGWSKTPGRNNGDEQGSSTTFKTSNDAMKYLFENKIDPTSKEGLEILDKVGKE